MQKNNERNNQLKLFSLVAAALLTAVSVALAPLNVYIPLFGVSSLRFTLTDIPVFLGGALFGPVIGLICGFLSDVLGFIIAPAGPYFFGFTISKMAAGFIPGMIFYVLRNKEAVDQEKIRKVNLTLSLAALMGAAFYLNVVAAEDVKKLGSILGVPMSIAITVLMAAVVMVLAVTVTKMTKVFEAREGIYKLQTVVLAVSVNYIIVSLILSPIWVHALYNVPIFASVIARIFKSLIDVPLQVTICYTVLQAIPMKVRQKILC